MIEQFKPIKGYEGHYEVSNLGRVRSIERISTRKDGCKFRVSEKILEPYKNNNGGFYSMQVVVSKNSKMELLTIAKIVLQSFVDGFNPKTDRIVYKDGNYQNLALNNLSTVMMTSRAGGSVTIKRSRRKPLRYRTVKLAGMDMGFDHKRILDTYVDGTLEPSKGMTIVFDIPFTYSGKTIDKIKI